MSEANPVKISVKIPTKKLINRPETSVDDNLRGLVATFPQLRLHPKQRLTTFQQNEESARVAIISGGGSGHEPFSAGYVGKGMLSGAVSGSIFTSPPTSHVLYAITYLHRFNKGGVFVVIPNYTGDRLNFGMAIEKARNTGVNVESVIVDEDLASEHGSCAGSRGMCGLTVIYKICGALAAENAKLEMIQKTASDVLSNMATFGVSLRACSIPGQAPLFEVAVDEMELGTGVHGEAGISRAKLGTASEVTGLVLDRIVQHLNLKAGSKVVALANNMGGTTTLEMNIVCAEIAEYFKKRGIKLARLYSGHIMTCLDMHGFQVNVTKLKPSEEEVWLRLLDAPTEASAWTGCSLSVTNEVSSIVEEDFNESSLKIELKRGPQLNSESRKIFQSALTLAAKELIVQEDKLNRLDAGCGDGDCGSTLKNLAEAVLKYTQTDFCDRPADVFAKLSEIAETDMGGTSGGIYSLGFAAASRIIAEEKSITPVVWAKAWTGANDAIMKYGRARPGDRTMVDTLIPAADAFVEALEGGNLSGVLEKTISAVEDGAKSTAAMKARAGRASYVGEDHLGGEDAGARGTAVWLIAVLSYILQQQ